MPCKGSLSSSVQSTCQFESYILIPVEGHFQTLNGKVLISWVVDSVFGDGGGKGILLRPFTSVVVSDIFDTHSGPWFGWEDRHLCGGALEERGVVRGDSPRGSGGARWLPLPIPGSL